MENTHPELKRSVASMLSWQRAWQERKRARETEKRKERRGEQRGEEQCVNEGAPHVWRQAVCPAGRLNRRCEWRSGAATRPGERRNVGGTITHSWRKEWQGGAARLARPGSLSAAIRVVKIKMFVLWSHNNNVFNERWGWAIELAYMFLRTQFLLWSTSYKSDKWAKW